MSATMGQGNDLFVYSIFTPKRFSGKKRKFLIKVFMFTFFLTNSGNVVGVAPYAVGTPACTSYGMYPSSRYSGLCVTTSTYYAPNNNFITQRTYTLRTERLRPTVYRTVSPVRRSTYRRYTQPQTSAIQSYRRALRAYQNPHQSYDLAQRNYQRALQAYAAAYQTSPATYSYSRYYG